MRPDRQKSNGEPLLKPACQVFFINSVYTNNVLNARVNDRQTGSDMLVSRLRQQVPRLNNQSHGSTQSPLALEDTKGKHRRTTGPEMSYIFLFGRLQFWRLSFHVVSNRWDPYPSGGVIDTVEESLSVIWCKDNVNEIEKISVDINYKLVDLPYWSEYRTTLIIRRPLFSRLMFRKELW